MTTDDLSREIREIRRILIMMDMTMGALEAPSRHTSLVRTKLEEGSMWAGALLGDIGNENPYKNDGKRTEKHHIEDRVDVPLEGYPSSLLNAGRIPVVDTIREDLKVLWDRGMNLTEGLVGVGYPPSTIIYYVNLLSSIKGARMWLGMELGRIKKEA